MPFVCESQFCYLVLISNLYFAALFSSLGALMFKHEISLGILPFFFLTEVIQNYKVRFVGFSCEICMALGS